MKAIDVRHLGRERVICSYLVDGLLVDPGPESCLETLLSALGGERPRALLLTHIHLDHAGASGTLVRRFPGLEVYVHEVGAPHLIAPERLLRSAARLYGDEMQRLWGEVLPVPEERVRVLRGGETVHGVRVAYTPGHASHHVSYLHEESGTALVGDAAGVRIPPASLVVAPTPPPDIDLAAWQRSLGVLREWRPQALGITHFGLVEEPERHLAALGEELARLDALDASAGRDAFVVGLRARIEAAGDAELAEAYEQAAPREQLWLGLERYWTRRAAAPA